MRFEKSGNARMTERSRRAHLSSVLVVTSAPSPAHAPVPQPGSTLAIASGRPRNVVACVALPAMSTWLHKLDM